MTGNSPPKFDVSLKETLEVYSGVSQFVHIEAKDVDGPITFQVKFTKDGVTTSTDVSAATTAVPNAYRASYSLFLEDTTTVLFRVLAIDSEGATAIYAPAIVLCACQHNGQCDFDSVQVKTHLLMHSSINYK